MAPAESPDRACSPPLGVVGSLLFFGGAGLVLFLITHVAIPALAARTGAEPVVVWFMAAGLGLFGPLLLVTWVLLRREGLPPTAAAWTRRLRFRRMNHGDWLWSLAALGLIGLSTSGMLAVLRAVNPDVRLHPSFLTMEPLGPGRYWILAAWLPFFAVNILGEEILWHGLLLPRQEAALGRSAWLVNGLGWLVFHVPFGLVILLMLWPTVFIIPYVVQRRQNTWTGVAIHAGLNGPGFLAVALGFV